MGTNNYHQCKLVHLLLIQQTVILHESLSGNSLVVQWLGLHAVTTKVPGSIFGQGTKIPNAVLHTHTRELLSVLAGLPYSVNSS